MKNKNKIIIISAFSLIIIFATSTSALADCAWRTQTITTNPELGGGNISGGCYSSEHQAIANNGESCSGTKPERISNGFVTTDSLCCCSAQTSAQTTAPEPKFKIPELQIDLPGLNLTQPTCEPNEDNGYQCKVNWLGEYLTWIYNYALKIGGILAAVMLMAGGLLWLISGGDAGKVGQAKEIIIGSITGLVILMSSYVILIQVNPELVNFPSITLGALTKDSIPIPENTTTFSDKCKPTTTGACAVSNMSIFGSRAEQASAICMAESGGNPNAFNSLTKCGSDGYAVWGLFQFNLSANKFTDASGTTLNCPAAFSKVWTNSSPSCEIVNKPLYDACVAAATNPTLSIQNAYKLAKNGWGPWEANSKWCHFGSGTGVTGAFNTSGWTFDTGVANQVGDAGPELGGLLNCMRPLLNSGVGKISSISDSNYIGNLSICNQTNCATTPSCAHSCASCHYGGGLTTNKSYAVDFGDEGNAAALTAAARTCDSGAYILNEGDHLHVSVSACPRQ